MDRNTALIITTIFSALSSISFLLLIIGLFKPSLVMRRPSLQTRRGIFLVWGLSAFFFTGGGLLVQGISEKASETAFLESREYYIKSGSANVRECPSTSCEIIDSLPQNEKLVFPGNLFDKYPEWVEVTFPNGQIGYVSKTTLSEKPVSEKPLTPADDASSVGGVTIGPWNDIQTIVGESYELYFCEPPSAISGATCGALSDTTTDPRGGTPPYSFIKKSGFLPPGMVLELNGTLRGSPTKTGTYNFRLCAKDLYGGEGCQNLVVVVNKGSDNVSDQPKDEPTLLLPAGPSVTPQVSIDSVSCEIVGVHPQSIEGYPDYLFVIKASGKVTGDISNVLSLHTNPLWAGGTDQNPTMLTGGWKTIYWNNYPDRSDELLRVSGNPATTAWSYSTGGVLDSPKRTGRTSQSVDVRATLYGNEDRTIFLGNDKATVVCSL